MAQRPHPCRRQSRIQRLQQLGHVAVGDRHSLRRTGGATAEVERRQIVAQVDMILKDIGKLDLDRPQE